MNNITIKILLLSIVYNWVFTVIFIIRSDSKLTNINSPDSNDSGIQADEGKHTAAKQEPSKQNLNLECKDDDLPVGWQICTGSF